MSNDCKIWSCHLAPRQSSKQTLAFADISCICRKIFECNSQESSLTSCNRPCGVQMKPAYPLHQLTNPSAPGMISGLLCLGLLCASGKHYLFKQGDRRCPGGSSGSLSYNRHTKQRFSLVSRLHLPFRVQPTHIPTPCALMPSMAIREEAAPRFLFGDAVHNGYP